MKGDLMMVNKRSNTTVQYFLVTIMSSFTHKKMHKHVDNCSYYETNLSLLACGTNKPTWVAKIMSGPPEKRGALHVSQSLANSSAS